MATKQDLVFATILAILVASLYIYTAAPSVYDGDSGELSAVVNTLGLAHPTGFPLYILSGKIFTLLVPVKDVAFRLNIYSAILVSLAIFFMFLTLRNMNLSKISALTASLILAFGNTIWSHAGAAGVYALGMFLASILFFLFSKWMQKKERKYIYYYALTLGLGFGTHAMLILMMLPLFLMVWLHMQDNRKLTERRISLNKIFLFLLLPIIQYAYIPIAYARNGIVNFGAINDIKGIIDYITQGGYAYKLGQSTLSNFLNLTSHLFMSEFTVFFFLIAILGGLALWKKDKKNLLVTTSIIVGNVLLLYWYGNAKDAAVLFRYYFISYLALTILIAYGIEFILQLFGKTKNITLIYFLTGAVLLTPLIPLTANFTANDRHKNYIISDYAENALQTVEENSILITSGDSVTGPLWYLQSIGRRKDIILIDYNLLISTHRDWYVINLNKKYPDIVKLSLLEKNGVNRFDSLINDNIDKYPIYTVVLREEMASRFAFIPIGITYKIKKGAANEISLAQLVELNNKLWSNYALRLTPNHNKSFMVEGVIKKYSGSLNNLGIVYRENNLVERAIESFQKSLEIYPNNELAKKNLEDTLSDNFRLN